MSTDYKSRNKLIKQALADEFGYNNVQVKSGTGTARHWVEINVKLWSSEKHQTHQEIQAIEHDAKSEVRKIIKRLGIKFDTYTPDDGIEEPQECVLIRVRMQ